MFVIRPVDNKEIQEELCGACQCAYLAEDFAYFAADLSEDGSFPGTFDEEVMIIMIRTAMEFVHRCGCSTMILAEGACDPAFGEKIGFRMQDGQYQIDLVEFYKSPCHFQAKLTKNDAE